MTCVSRSSPGAQMSDVEILPLLPNQVPRRPYRGGSGIARFRGRPHRDPFTPEDFVGSTTQVASGGGVGLSKLADGELLCDAIRRAPDAYLGAGHNAAFGPDPRLLTKLLSTDQRLFIHAHPDDRFARRSMKARHGQTESWIIVDIDAEMADPYVLLGFSRDVTLEELTCWFSDQNVPGMATAMNRVSVRVGDTLHVPAGVPHGIGPGITLVELQQPADLSLSLEHHGYPGLTSTNALMGLPVQLALSALRRTAVTREEITEWKRGRRDSGRVRQLLPGEADPFYRAWRIGPGSHTTTLARGYAIVVVLSGAGHLTSGRGRTKVQGGQTWLVTHAAGEVSVSADLDVVWCRPPEPSYD